MSPPKPEAPATGIPRQVRDASARMCAVPLPKYPAPCAHHARLHPPVLARAVKLQTDPGCGAAVPSAVWQLQVRTPLTAASACRDGAWGG